MAIVALSSRLRARWLVHDGAAIAVTATRPTRGVVSGERGWGHLEMEAAMLLVTTKTCRPTRTRRDMTSCGGIAKTVVTTSLG